MSMAFFRPVVVAFARPCRGRCAVKKKEEHFFLSEKKTDAVVKKKEGITDQRRARNAAGAHRQFIVVSFFSLSLFLRRSANGWCVRGGDSVVRNKKKENKRKKGNDGTARAQKARDLARCDRMPARRPTHRRQR